MFHLIQYRLTRRTQVGRLLFSNGINCLSFLHIFTAIHLEYRAHELFKRKYFDLLLKSSNLDGLYLHNLVNQLFRCLILRNYLELLTLPPPRTVVHTHNFDT